jgi:hypothetical protein
MSARAEVDRTATRSGVVPVSSRSADHKGVLVEIKDSAEGWARVIANATAVSRSWKRPIRRTSPPASS